MAHKLIYDKKTKDFHIDLMWVKAKHLFTYELFKKLSTQSTITLRIDTVLNNSLQKDNKGFLKKAEHYFKEHNIEYKIMPTAGEPPKFFGVPVGNSAATEYRIVLRIGDDQFTQDSYDLLLKEYDFFIGLDSKQKEAITLDDFILSDMSEFFSNGCFESATFCSHVAERIRIKTIYTQDELDRLLKTIVLT